MKTILMLIAFLTFINTSNGQQKITFTEVVLVDSTVSKLELFDRIKTWFATTFVDSKAVLDISNRETGELLGKGSHKFVSSLSGSLASNGYIKYTIKIYTKDGRYKCEITDFIHEGSSGISYGVSYPAASLGIITDEQECPEGVATYYPNQKWKTKLWVEIKNEIQSFIPQIIKKLKSDVSIPSPSKSEDW